MNSTFPFQSIYADKPFVAVLYSWFLTKMLTTEKYIVDEGNYRMSKCKIQLAFLLILDIM